jgi:dTDP-D-glucose 4,6-dehydratase
MVVPTMTYVLLEEPPRVGACNHAVLVVDKLTYADDLESLKPVFRFSGYSFVRADIVDAAKIRDVIESFQPDVIMQSRAREPRRWLDRQTAAFIENECCWHLRLPNAAGAGVFPPAQSPHR